MWVGLGGYKLTSPAVEQVGTELDCVGGHPTSSAWYELAPSSSHRVRIGVHPGDLIAASVTAAGGRVIVEMSDLTSHRTFHRTISPSSPIDVSSAEWILEAPSACVFGTSACQTLPLANFGGARFNLARAQTTSGPLGTISTAGGQDTKIILGPRAPLFVNLHPGQVPVGTATPSGLINGGSSFTIKYQRRYVQGGLQLGPRARGLTYLRH
jgi:Peptidase A4 family